MFYVRRVNELMNESIKGKKQPNVLFIMTDQQRFDYLGCMGADFLRTPHIDGIAERGIKFNYCCTTAPICAPARIALATGLLPNRLGALENEVYLPINNISTYYQRLRDHGYQVGCVGKLDLAKPDTYNGKNGNRPCAYTIGFTMPLECEGKEHAYSSKVIGPYTAYLEEKGLLDKLWDAKKGHKQIKNHKIIKSKAQYDLATADYCLDAEDYEDAFIGRKAVDWLENITDEYPWHLFVSFVGPHYPYDPPTSYADQYRHQKVPLPIKDDMSGKPLWIKGRAGASYPNDEEILVSRRQYCASISLIDDQVGRILATLEGRGMLDNTYIIFASDHGDMMGDHNLYSKQVAYEASLRVPLMVAGPNIAPGRESDALIELSDLNPTICELAGLPPQHDIDARSFGRLLFETTKRHRKNTVCFNLNFRAIRTRDYKFINNYNDLPELYDLNHDPQELCNIADQHPAIVRELTQALRSRYQEGKWLR
jgi:choline-sulfatase